MQGLNEIAENDPAIIEKTVKDLQSISANISSYDTMIDMFIKSNSNLADNLATLEEVLPEIKMLSQELLMLQTLPTRHSTTLPMTFMTRLTLYLKP